MDHKHSINLYLLILLGTRPYSSHFAGKPVAYQQRILNDENAIIEYDVVQDIILKTFFVDYDLIFLFLS